MLRLNEGMTSVPGPGRLPPQARALLPLVVPALVVGVTCSLVLLALSFVSEKLEHFAWTWLPGQLGVGNDNAAWTVAMLTVTGVLVGLTVWRYPGLIRPDPAAMGLVDAPLPLNLLPGIAIAVALGLGGGVSLGPENPITAINIALAFHLGRRLLPKVVPAQWIGLAVAGTVGALFGTPVAAALILSETGTGKDPRPLWDRLFAPLLAAGAGALTTVAVANPVFAVSLPAYPGFHLIDAVSATVIGGVAAALGLAGVYVYPRAHRAFHLIAHPLPRLAACGLILGALGALGGRISLFKGLDEMKELVNGAGSHSAGNLALLTLVKLAALILAATAGFWGGRIFPAVFVGVALGLFAQRLVPGVPVSLAVACAILGVLLATTRQGWLSLFTAATITGDIRLLPVLCIATLPAWLIVTGRPEMAVPKSGPDGG